MAKGQQRDTRDTVVSEHGSYTITRRDRHWEIRDPTGDLVCLTVYKRGAEEVIRRLKARPAVGIEPTTARL
jgi:hypothetical protein